MNPETKEMTLTEKVEAACKRVAAKVIERARQTGTPVILWENGRIVKRSWEELVTTPTSTSNPIRAHKGGSEAAQAPNEAAEEGIG